MSAVLWATLLFTNLHAQVNFSQSELDFNGNGSVGNGVTSLMYGPDGRLYVAEYPGTIKILTINRVDATNYQVIAAEDLNSVISLANHDDDGTPCSGSIPDCAKRETTGLTVAGTASNPIIYVTSSDFRIGSGLGGGNGDVDLDTNSGILTRISWNGSSWDVVDLVRGLPRSEENHATNGLELVTVNGIEYLIVASGGNTNGGGPSTNFVYTCEYALSGALISVDLTALNALPILNDNGRDYIYDIPTLDDPTRANVNGIIDPDSPGYNGIDINDPFGGNDGLNQAMVVPGSPIQIFSPGYRNAYDLVITESGAVYATDNGANQGWGGFPVNEGGGTVTNAYDSTEPGSSSPAADGEYINNEDHLQLITTDIQTYSFGSLYGGHPNPIRANPNGAGLFTAPASNGTTGAVFRTLIYDPDGSQGPGYTTDPNIALPANWPPVSTANPVEGDFRGPGLANPEGPVDNEVTIWGTNTNGIDEYTASNFGNAMQGDLIAGVNSGVLRRAELNPDGSLETLTDTFASGLGGNALGITCNSDTDPFPGSIWAGTLNGKIIVLEPSDLINCINPGEPGYDANADYDSDGYTNQDEEDNGTDPCNGGSQPADFDKSAGGTLISDLNDTDDDDDGILDQDDPFQLGNPNSSGSDAFAVPIQNGLFNDQQGLGGIFGLGLTGLMNNGDANPNWMDWLDDIGQGPNPDDVLGGAPGLMTSHMTSGTANGSSNTQEKGYQYGVEVDNSTGSFTVSGNLLNFSDPNQLYGNSAAIGGELGLFIGDGTQSNFIKFVLTTAGLTALQEIGDVPQTPINVPIAIPNRPQNSVVFYFIVDPSTGIVELEYSLDLGVRTSMGATLTAQGSILDAIQQSNQDLAVGFIGTSNTTAVELEGTWDFLNVIGSTPTVSQNIPDIYRLINTADEDIELDNFFDDDYGTTNLTYTIESNTNNAVGAVINGSILTLSYPGTPNVTTITIRATDNDLNFVEQSFLVTVTDTPVALYRINTGGPQIAAIDSGIDWEEDTPGNNSQYLVTPGGNQAFSFGMNGYTSEVNQSTTPISVFDTERADNIPGVPNMSYSFPVASQGNYEVRLYLGNGWSGTSSADQRIFDVEIEGVVYPLLNDIDLSGTYGHQIGTAISHIMQVADGSIDISFVHGLLENPIVNAIEILHAPDTETPIYVNNIDDQTSFTGAAISSLGVEVTGGDGNLNYSATGLPNGISIEPTNGHISGTIDVNADANSPYNVNVTVDDSDGLTSDAVTISFNWIVNAASAFRINVSGDELETVDNDPKWQFNNVDGSYVSSIYSVNTGVSLDSGLEYSNRDNSIPAYINEATFNGIFERERYDASALPEMIYTLPLDNGDYMVNIYLGNSYEPANQIGDRVFDILIEDNIVKDDLDVIDEFGHLVAGMLSFPVTLTDGNMNIEFAHGVAENPILNAIEVFEVDSANPTLILDSVTAQTSDINEAVSVPLSASGGDPVESMLYYISGQPQGLTINETSGLIAGTIDQSSSSGGPLGDGVHEVVVTVKKPRSAPDSKVFTWSVASSWIDKDEDETYTARHENSFVQAGNQFYLMGGRENAKTIDIYDYTSDTWTSLVDSAPFEFNHFQAVEYQGFIWVIGAFKDNNYPIEAPAENVWAFNPANEEWIEGPQIPISRRRGSAGLVVYNDKFYIIAGNNDGHDGGYLALFDEYDPATGVWTALDDAPRARDHFAAVVIGDKLYVSGGRLSGGPGGTFGPTIPEVDVYDFSGSSWSTLPSGQNIPTPRGGASAVSFNDKLIVIGGETEVAGPSLTTTEEYNPNTQTWQTLAGLNNPRHGTQAIVSGQGIFILGGSPAQGGGNQKNMEYFGVDSPIGTPSVESVINALGGVLIADGSSEDIDLNIEAGNVGVIVTSMVLSGPNAADFNILSGELSNQLLKPNSTHTITVELTGSGADRNAILTVNYGNNGSLDIALSNSNIAPLITNPGTQNNNEGDSVTLPIIASDASINLTYMATGLPPTLTIDNNTGVISGTVSAGGGSEFLENNGLVIIEMESLTYDTNWTEESIESGFTGSGYLNNHTDSFLTPGTGTITAEINISAPGTYRVQWHNKIGIIAPSSPTTEHNDAWLRFPDASEFYGGYTSTTGLIYPVGSGQSPVGNGPGADNWFKVYTNTIAWNWSSLTSDNDAHNVYVTFDTAGVYTMEISSRSNGHFIDRVALHNVDQNYTQAQLLAAPESSTGGGGGASENSPYTVEVTVTDDMAPALSSSEQFIWNIGQIGDIAPTAVASATPLTGPTPLEVTFTGSNSTDDIAVTGYLWDFKDGSPTVSIADPMHTFTTAGIYDVELTVSDGAGLTNSTTVQINVSVGNEAPIAVASATPFTGSAPLEVNFTGSNSTDDVAVTGYLWDFKDGSPTVTLSDPEHTFTTEGIYDVELTVSDGAGLTNTTTVQINVSVGNEAPIAVASATPLSGDAPLEVSFTGSNSTDDVAVTGYSWDFKDGSPIVTLTDPTHTFNTEGEYVVELTVEDVDGLTNMTTITITVSLSQNEAPVAVATASPTAGTVDLAVIFNGSGSTDDQGIVGYLWDFKDGFTSDQENPTHLFETTGVFDVDFTVTDAQGLSDTDTVTITVNEINGNMPPVAAVSATPENGNIPLEVTFTGDDSTDDLAVVSYLWDFADGITSNEANPIHIFDKAGTYNVTLTVTDGEGLTDVETISIIVVSENVDTTGRVYPNPASDVAKIPISYLPTDKVVINLSLYDSTGRHLQSFTPSEIFTNEEYEIPVHILRNGIYHIRIEFSNADPIILGLIVKK